METLDNKSWIILDNKDNKITFNNIEELDKWKKSNGFKQIMGGHYGRYDVYKNKKGRIIRVYFK